LAKITDYETFSLCNFVHPSDAVTLVD